MTAYLVSTGPMRRSPDGEREALCRMCGEWWPLADEFWIRGKSMSRCRACWYERNNAGTRARMSADPEYRERRPEQVRMARRRARERAA